MKAKIKLILFCILAFGIGLAYIAPLAFNYYEEDLKPRVDVETILAKEPPLSFNLTYVYVGDYWKNNSNINDGNYGLKYDISYRTISNIDIKSFPGRQRFAAFEYYTLEVSTEKGVIATLPFNSYAYSTGWGLYNGSFFDFGSQSWFSSNSSNKMDLPSNSQEGPELDGNGTAHGQLIGSANDWNISAGKPETMFVTVRRLGWVIFDDNNTIVQNASSEPLAQAELQNYSIGFIYNKLYTQSELSQINPVLPEFKFLR